ncbi:hypothetical protein OPW41_02260 [Vibrio europaeus]|uniref:hypothetical protein n=1 Tax=Vibrio europaeus TaxID=300876 RepID=UPI00233EF6E4|nr:hypothetical protein [Vibrio europaeus]MDC5753758.1 hypothetical protein [Vibrio europaeus]MDC5778329.1 hypothetical protein [Vibrio europaeus]MDC5793631.1 hypothetical protein [Vibrio europaeus]MDC5798938.1 hypothetical protein [Vibrio europaeus]MDC5815050.1 hypothetical protein [Vibrio europaeus]
MLFNKILLGAGLAVVMSGCAELKEAGTAIGHSTRDTTTAIGHASRDAVNSVKEDLSSED